MESIITTITSVFAGISAFAAAIALYFNWSAIKRQNKFETLKFVTDQFDYLDQIGARKLLLEMKNKPILTFIIGSKKNEQLLKQYIYAFNRIAAGIHHGALDKKIVFSVWPEQWFIEKWKKFEPLIEKEQEERNKDKKGPSIQMYNEFRWLAK